MSRLAELRKKIVSNTRRLRFHRPEVGSRPGVLAFSEEAADTQVNVICYAPEVHLRNPEKLPELILDEKHLVWIDVQGLGTAAEIRRIAEMAQIPDLMLEDMVNVPQRSHASAHENRLLVVTRMVRPFDRAGLFVEQVSIYRYKNIVVTFQEAEGDVFSPIRDRLKLGRGPLRNGTSDFLVYTLLDTIIDAYFPLLEHLADRLQLLEHYALTRPTSALLRYLVESRNEIVRLHRAIKPQKEVLQTLIRNKQNLLGANVLVHLEDTYDHALQASDVSETLREMSVNLLNLYMSSMANHTNDKMKVLTIMASIFIPLTFIAGIYGMNFEYMPELHAKWGYPAVWLLMSATAFSLLYYFYRKGWLGENNREIDLTLREHLAEMQLPQKPN
ncbi:magnesium/cobalt transporter CorA [Rubinisphaera italica]|uniref:Magnesium transport protein CorA n=1 Tax=Rubinisphaera italica TaxID=2527969 RepID=A0A5C5XHR9_9PLAN|nr:magnesium/cobalt transporter CorA [Rubinisphaera italica]TWT61873.1 Magnesium transport protein CorA [Rubinisphaera italica]